MRTIEDLLADYKFDELATAGYHLALRVGFAFPEFQCNTLPKEWIKVYTANGLMTSDPVIRWIYENTGYTRWSDIPDEDGRNVLPTAASFGLRYGAAISVMCDNTPGLRSYGSFARSDRELTDQELTDLIAAVENLHRALAPARALTAAEIDVLAMLASGLQLKQIAHRLAISESAVKLRLTNARSKLGARTNTQAVGQAKGFGWI
ncbi:helix-turn-helix transcriptional regulator [Qingshengfaniella alkalisoli]|uniref:LuxR family transcriptional regulator n=1 Tax=Qingshengfaniella alkalisoli TaxID=2599296 RepID=A0A5B8IYC6_9RHOB|nr:LuxR family transcriptional regulator [Qingshengfaniella alkalisoli]QDY71142.1 LuxR family transcriptional regulator [Qingshengfaniella alkalisoli]